ncbi:MAG: hypothetical protein V3V03_06770 [Hyphomonadaceae bacterium]
MERDDQPLDLSVIDPPVWQVLVSDTAYGPYTLGQMQTFVREGRVSADTKIAEGDGSAFIPAGDTPVFAAAFAEAVRTDQTDDLANFIVITRLAGSGERAVTQALNELGAFGEAMPGVYLLRSRARLGRIRSRLQSLTDIADKVMIINATHDRLAWYNLGPEADVHIHAVWDKDMAED